MRTVPTSPRPPLAKTNGHRSIPLPVSEEEIEIAAPGQECIAMSAQGYFCTRGHDHEGDHVAHGHDGQRYTVCDRWAQEPQDGAA